MNIKSFVKTDKKEVEAVLIEDAQAEVLEAIEAQRANRAKALREAKKDLRRIETIRDVENFNAESWVLDRLEAKQAVALAEAELDNFNKVYSDGTSTEDEQG